MNISQKCNCCIKESVCKYKIDYECDCERIKQAIHGDTAEVSIKCKEFVSKSMTMTRELQNER